MHQPTFELREPIHVPTRAYVAYFLVGATILFLCLFPPTWLSNATSQLAWSPSGLPSPFQLSQTNPKPTPLATPAGLKSADGSSAIPTCYAWANLTAENAHEAKSLLSGNPSISGVQSTAQASKVGLAVVMPADLAKRTTLTKILAENKVDVANVVTLSNGNRAWAVGVFPTEAMAIEAKSSLAAKGAWNLVTESRAPATSIQFSTLNPVIAEKLNTFAKQHDWPLLTACK